MRDENGNVVGEITSTDQGKPGEKVKLTVDGLKPFSNYTAEVIVRNQEFATSRVEIPKKTVATSMSKYFEPEANRENTTP